MKIGDIKRKVAVEGVIILIALCVLGAAGYGLDYLSEDYVSESAALDGEISASTKELGALRDKYIKVQKNAFLYDEATQKNKDNMLSIDRDFIRNKIDDLKNQFSLSDIHLTVTPAQDVADKKGKSNVIAISDVALTFNALSDDDVYNFAQALQTELSGSVRITQFDVKREDTPLDAGLRAVIETGKFAFISGSIKFKWFGLRPLEAAAPATPPASGKP